MKRAIIAASISLALAMPAFAMDGGGPPQGPDQNLEQRKAEVLKRIDERLARLQQMKACIQRARTHDDARACREKFEVRDRLENRKR